jgi:hypothetical protein
MQRNPTGTYIAEEVHGAVIVGAAVASPRHDLEDQHAEAEDVHLGRHEPVHRVLRRHVAAAEDMGGKGEVSSMLISYWGGLGTTAAVHG